MGQLTGVSAARIQNRPTASAMLGRLFFHAIPSQPGSLQGRIGKAQSSRTEVRQPAELYPIL